MRRRLRRVASTPMAGRWLRLAERYDVDNMTVRRYLLVAGSPSVAVRAPATAAVGHAATTDSGQIQLALKCPEPIVHGPFHSRLVFGRYRRSSVSAIGARCLSSWRKALVDKKNLQPEFAKTVRKELEQPKGPNSERLADLIKRIGLCLAIASAVGEPSSTREQPKRRQVVRTSQQESSDSSERVPARQLPLPAQAIDSSLSHHQIKRTIGKRICCRHLSRPGPRTFEHLASGLNMWRHRSS